MAAAATERRLARKSRFAAARKRDFPRLHAEGFYDAVAGDGLVENILHVGELILPAARGRPDAPANAHRRKNDERNKQQEHPGKLTAQNHDKDRSKDEGEELLQKLRQHARHGELDPFDVVDDGRDQCSSCVL
jgi:hypothetical protein